MNNERWFSLRASRIKPSPAREVVDIPVSFEVKLAEMVSQAAQAGRLDVSSVDWECLGGMKPLAVQLKQYALESSLPAASPKPRSSFRM